MSSPEPESLQEEVCMDSVTDNLDEGEPGAEAKVEITDLRDSHFHFDVYETPPFLLTIVFAMQQVLMSLSRSVSTSLLIADIVCARTDENFKARHLSTTMFISGVTTLLQNTIGIRLPLYQGPAATYVIPLLAMSTLPSWSCPDDASHDTMNMTDNGTVDSSPGLNGMSADSAEKLERMVGSLIIAGGVHMLFGLTGLVGVLMRFIGPVTIVPTLTIVGLYIYRAAANFAMTQWGVALLTVATAMVFSFYLRNYNCPIPAWSKGIGFHIRFFPVQKMFSVLLACLLGWLVSGILTSAGAFSEDPTSKQFYARTDTRLHVVEEADWFILPYPTQFGNAGFDTGAFVAFMIGTISSIIDSIGDYYACSKICEAPPPPNHAVNRGIAVEGFMSLLGGWCGTGHATSTFGGNIGAIGITKVASLRVFQVVGIIFIIFGVVGKIGAIFVTIPYSVVGGMMMINFGLLIGVMMSNMQFLDMKSTRNLAIIGMSMLIGLMTPYWIKETPDAINTGVMTLDSVLMMLLSNPMFVAGFLSCFLDNTIPGSLEERGMVAWKAELGVSVTTGGTVLSPREQARVKRLLKTIYTLPLAERLLKRMPALRFIPIYPK